MFVQRVHTQPTEVPTIQRCEGLGPEGFIGTFRSNQQEISFINSLWGSTDFWDEQNPVTTFLVLSICLTITVEITLNHVAQLIHFYYHIIPPHDMNSWRNLNEKELLFYFSVDSITHKIYYS